LAGLGVIDTNCRALVSLSGHSQKIYYHPAGNEDILLELKCDFLNVDTAIGNFSQEKNEIEIEIKWVKDMSEAQANKIVEEEMQRVIRFVAENYGNEDGANIAIIKSSKPQEAFEYLEERRKADEEAFAAKVAELPFNGYGTPKLAA
jgi:hypothetical protein